MGKNNSIQRVFWQAKCESVSKSQEESIKASCAHIALSQCEAEQFRLAEADDIKYYLRKIQQHKKDTILSFIAQYRFFITSAIILFNLCTDRANEFRVKNGQRKLLQIPYDRKKDE